MSPQKNRTLLENVPEPPEEEIKAAVQNLREWIVKEPHLPNIDDDEWLKTFFYNNKFSLEKTKFKLDNYYSLRNKYPHLFKSRDPTSPWVADYLPYFSFSNKVTADGVRQILMKYDLDTVDKFQADDYFKFISMIMDLLLLEKDRLTSYVILIDMQNYTYKHFLRIISGAKAAAEILAKAFTERLEVIHLFNVPSFIERVLVFFKSIVPEKYVNRILVNTASNDRFLEMFDEKDLPSDLGGEGPSWAECEDWTRRKLEEHKKWFVEQDDVCSIERLRRKDDSLQLEDMKGSFRKLEVD